MTSPSLVLISMSPVSQSVAQQYLTPFASDQMSQSSQKCPQVQGSPWGSWVVSSSPPPSHNTAMVQSDSQESLQSLEINVYIDKVGQSLHVVFPVRLERLRTVSMLSVEDATEVLSYIRPHHPHTGARLLM